MNRNNQPKPPVKAKAIGENYVAWTNLRVRRGATLNGTPLVDIEATTSKVTFRLTPVQATHLAERLTEIAEQQANYQKGNR